MKKRTSRLNSDTVKEEPVCLPVEQLEADNDISLLQRPLRTAHAGFEEARRAYEDGTQEVRRLLTQECSLIYECNVCRNMFRSLANFISHKRVFCCQSARTLHQNGYTDHNSTMIIQAGNGPSSQDIEHMMRSRSTGCSPVPREVRPIRGSMRDLSGVIERLRREKAPFVRRSTNTVLQLEAVPTSSQAVYQTVKREVADSIKTEVNEVHHMLNQGQTIVGPDGKAMTTHHYERQVGGGSDSNETAEQSNGDEAETNIFCEICNLTFQTNKTLELHIQKHHSSSAFVFQCPACSLTFLQAAAVIRHLSKDHKKPTRRIRMMRNTILKRRVQQGDVQPKAASRELKRLQLSDDVVSHVPERLDAAASERRKIMSLCIYCEKSFERRAALSTHLLNCRAKQEALAKPAPSVKKLKIKPNGSTASSIETEDVAVDSIERSLEQAADAAAETDSNALNEMFADLAEQNETFAAGLQTVSLDKMQLQHESDSASDEASNTEDELELEQEGHTNTDVESKAQEGAAGEPHKVKKKRNVPIEKQLRCRCKLCHKQFNALGNLRRHISMFHYRARRFGCTMCDYRAFRRYDIVNHLVFTHKIEGDREQLTEQYVATHECKYSRDDVDGDIVLLGEEESKPTPPPSAEVDAKPTTAEMKLTTKTYEKRLKRFEAATTEFAMDEQVAEPTPNKKRRQSRTPIGVELGVEHPIKTGGQGSEKRPIRKRVKAVNKDFVYDLVSFKAVPEPGATATTTTSAIAATDSMRAKLRRHNSSTAVGTEESKLSGWEAYITEAKKCQVQGTTRRIMLDLISQGRAVSATLPELPAERPQIRPRLTSQARSECGRHVVETGGSANESFIEKIAKRTAAAGAAKDAAVISHLWEKVNTVIAQQKQETDSNRSTYQKEPPLADYKTPNGKHSGAELQLTPPSPPRKSTATPTPTSTATYTSTSSPLGAPPANMCLANSEQITSASVALTQPVFPALPKPPSVLAAAASGTTIQFTLDSLLRAALQH